MIVLFVFGYMFYKLAYNFDKSPWTWAVVGAASYIVIQLGLGFCIGLLYGMGVISTLNETAITIGGVIVSSLVVYLGYRYLKNKWEKEDTRFDAHVIDNIGKTEE